MVRLQWLVAVYLVVTILGQANSEDNRSIKTRLQENITGYRSRYSLTRGQMQPKPKIVKESVPVDQKIQERDEDGSFLIDNIIDKYPPILMMALNQEDQAKNGLESHGNQKIQERDEDGNFLIDNIIDKYPPILMMALNQEDQAKDGLEDTENKKIQKKDEDGNIFLDNIKNLPILMMALNQEDLAKDGLEENNGQMIQERDEDGNFLLDNIKVPPILMMALNQEDQAKNRLDSNGNPKIQERDEDGNFLIDNIIDKYPPVLMMALNQEDQAKDGLKENKRQKIQEGDADGNFLLDNIKYPPVLMMALNQEDGSNNIDISSVLMMALNQQDERKNGDQIIKQRDVNAQSSNFDISKITAVLMMALNQQDEANSLLQEDSQKMNKREVDTNDYKTVMMSVKQSPQTVQGGERQAKDDMESDASTKSLSFLLSWLGKVQAMRSEVSTNEGSYFNDWVKYMKSLRDCSNKKPVGRNQALAAMGLSDFFLDIFWPFRYDINLMNQRLAVSGFETQEHTEGDGHLTKTSFVKGVEKMLGIHLPVKENEVILSFDDEEVIEELLRTGILNISNSFKSAGKHVFPEQDKQRILKTANSALKLINETSPDLYKSIVQMISVIAFYKAENSHFTGGTGPSLIGIIWLNPVNLEEWTVPFMAEQIVHEFTHNSLFCAELVHGMYRNGADLSKAQPISAIRHEQRDFDRCLHAAYVSASLITFHTRIGQFNRAHQLAETLTEAVQDLNTVNANTDVLDASGRGILQYLNDYMCLMRL